MWEAATRQAIEAVWRIESARLIGGLVRTVRDVGLAEDLAMGRRCSRGYRSVST
jgi:predicted RNA polymerase sigma factor